MKSINPKNKQKVPIVGDELVSTPSHNMHNHNMHNLSHGKTGDSFGEHKPSSADKTTHHSFDYSRYDFLKTAGSATIMAFFGITLASCSSSVTDSGTGTDPDPTDPDPTDPGDDGNGNSPITIEGDIVTLNLDSSRFEGLKSAGGWNLIEEAELLVVNVGGQTIRAFTSVCTHQQCKTSWQFNNDLFICTCHDSRFNTSGEVTSGPASANLQEYSVSRDGSTVTIDKS